MFLRRSNDRLDSQLFLFHIYLLNHLLFKLCVSVTIIITISIFHDNDEKSALCVERLYDDVDREIVVAVPIVDEHC
uniref:Bestrophin homolog n=1 Tax=Angiostrongylus cantonensis TaxID=6313 RepID=A0A0K0DAV8_ANGCA